jgi:hypothetical protein
LRHLPSSRSADFSGRISRDELKPLLKLLLFGQRSESCDGPVDPLQVEGAADAMLNAFAAAQAPGGETWVAWKEFSSVISTNMVRHVELHTRTSLPFTNLFPAQSVQQPVSSLRAIRRRP